MDEHGNNTVATRKPSDMIDAFMDDYRDVRRLGELTRGIAAAREVIIGLYLMLPEEQQQKVNNGHLYRCELRAVREAMQWA